MERAGLWAKLTTACLLSVMVPLAVLTSAHSAPQQEQTLPLGVIQPLTGPGAVWGRVALRVAEMAAEEINRKGVVVKGVNYKFKIIAEDDKYFADMAVDRLKKLIELDKVGVVFGSLGSASSVAEAPICAAKKVLNLTNGFDKNIIAAGNTYSFMMGLMPDLNTPGFINFLAQRVPTTRKIVLVYVDDATGQSSLRVSEPASKKQGWETISVGFERGVVEFGPLCAKVVGSKPDMILFMGVAAGDAQRITKGLRELGYKGALAHTGGFVLPELYKMVGDTIGLVYQPSGIGEKPYANDEYIAFYSEYVKRYGVETWAANAIVFYSWVKIYAQAIEKAQNLDSTVIRDLLATPGKEWYHIIGGKAYCITDKIAKEMSLGSNHYFNVVTQASTWDNSARRQVNAGWVYPYGWPGGEFPK